MRRTLTTCPGNILIRATDENGTERCCPGGRFVRRESSLRKTFGFMMSTSPADRPSLSVWDTVSIIVGIVVGTAIFKLPAGVFQNTSSVAAALGLWVAGGVISLIGALCYAELATTYPRSGGDYEYLTRAFGRWIGFQFAWAQLTIVMTGSIGSMAYAFADYAVRFGNLSSASTVWLAAGSVVVLSLFQLRGLIVGKRLQNILTLAKVVGFSAMIGFGLAFGDPKALLAQAPRTGAGLGLALVFVLYAYGGWNHAAFVTAEVSDPRRGIPRALILGLLVITGLYVAVNASCAAVLGLEGTRTTETPASDLLEVAIGPLGGKLAGILVMLSALGAINGMILTGARVYAVMGSDYRLLRPLGQWTAMQRAPAAAIIVQAGMVALMVFAVGTSLGRAAIDRILTICGAAPAPWETYFGGFETLIAASAPVFWFFFVLTGLSLFRLRQKDPDRERPFRVPCYPLPPILFALTSLFMLKSSLEYARSLSWLAVVPLVSGTVIFLAGGTQNDDDRSNRDSR